MAEFADRITRVATVFTASDFAVTTSYLEAYGIIVVAAPVHLINNFPHYTSAIGGAGVFVPERQAQAAINLLIEADREKTEIKDEEPKLMTPKTFFDRVMELFLYVYVSGGEASPPYASRIVHGQWQALGEEGI
ncbi:hypothetical protein [Rhizobium skierniewicense]|uniref:hypothetical protein n=1 Tax=Rhizobium skierniewicense TaxID=984260 RepID=UPI001574D8AB|nr:hypothetical protein [Rhizobium skierniewicense]NTF31239.1 hypothetical protein [Rhizobium skierniewicense]